MTSIVLFSGGLDSTAALYWALDRGERIELLSFDYPGRPIGEVQAAAAIATLLGIKLTRLHLPFLRRTGGKSESVSAEGYIPMRNLVFYAMAGHYAETNNMSRIIAGHTDSDGQRYSDAETTFFQLMEAVFRQTLLRTFANSSQELPIILPLASMTDSGFKLLVERLKIPLGLTWSCWRDGKEPCRECGACIERAETLLNINQS